ncbi:NAD-dependent epimerase/dehydratase family protein [Aquabacterium sp.]|uniref:NAD-dependent epimerase/dehydratase family protein n=1 Tax=Aquabacterium sp. TaxID=1872578 RepID=UPI00248938C1|nr:NAD-dependent epimerase/dehydratase family protein [Aquabacterium sp.]MDI1258071.1 NAD-dependent epimerase/dehydratase family protein [Aquabacterium sp.]
MAQDEEGVLVTGGCGFLGRALVNQLLREANGPINVLALPHEAVPPEWSSRVNIVRGDITRLQDVELAAQGCQRIFHLAALVGDGGTYAQHERVTVGGTAHVFDVALRRGASVVLTTSVCAYGNAIQRGVCHEGTPLGQPQGPYGRAKQGQEKLAWRFRDQGGQVCVVRPANIIGPGSGPWLLDAAQALRQGLPALVGGGRGNAALAIVDNVSTFLVQVANTPSAHGQAFNIHDGLPITWRRYFTDLAGLMGAPAPRSTPRALAYLGARAVEPMFRRFLPGRRPPVTREALNLIAWDNQFPTDKARSLGWAPVVDYPQILRSIQQDIQARGL